MDIRLKKGKKNHVCWFEINIIDLDIQHIDLVNFLSPINGEKFFLSSVKKRQFEKKSKEKNELH